MAAVETKVPGYFTDRVQTEEDDKEGFGTRTLVLKVRPPAPPPCPHALIATHRHSLRPRAHPLLARALLVSAAGGAFVRAR